MTNRQPLTLPVPRYDFREAVELTGGAPHLESAKRLERASKARRLVAREQGQRGRQVDQHFEHASSVEGWIACDEIDPKLFPGTWVEVKFRCGHTDSDCTAAAWKWGHSIPEEKDEWDIIAYRVR